MTNAAASIEPSTHLPVLVVDDDPDVRQVVRWALEDAAFDVPTAADGTARSLKRNCDPPVL